jgi:hypothetical protein
MSHLTFCKLARLSFFTLLLCLTLFGATGCGRDEVKVYQVAKELPSTSHAGHAHEPELPDDHPKIGNLKPELSWTLPAGWQETKSASRMTVAAFTITGKNGKEAQVAITPLRGMAGKEVPIINMWRQQVGLSEISADEAQKQLQPIQIGPDSGKMFEVTGKTPNDPQEIKIVTAMVHKADTSWFYKLAGDVDVVEAEKPAFVSFLKSIKFDEIPATEITATPNSKMEKETRAPTSEWKIPADWKAVEPGSMQTAKFSVPSKGSANADVTISVFPNSTGGTLGNVNRWRGQIGLPPVTEADLAKLVTKLDDKNPKAILVDMTNNERRLVGAIIPREGQWFFFKLLGDDDAVAPQKDAFIAFVKSPK